MTAPRTRASTVALAALIDVVLVVIFIAIGRQSHDESITLAGTLGTAWPFLAGLAVGWGVSFAWRRPLGILRPGTVLWASTLVIGMALRVVSGQGTALPFIIVAAVSIAVFLIGWRALATGFLHIRRGARHDV